MMPSVRKMGGAVGLAASNGCSLMICSARLHVDSAIVDVVCSPLLLDCTGQRSTSCS